MLKYKVGDLFKLDNINNYVNNSYEFIIGECANAYRYKLIPTRYTSNVNINYEYFVAAEYYTDGWLELNKAEYLYHTDDPVDGEATQHFAPGDWVEYLKDIYYVKDKWDISKEKQQYLLQLFHASKFTKQDIRKCLLPGSFYFPTNQGIINRSVKIKKPKLSTWCKCC